MSIYTKSKLGVDDNQVLFNDDSSDPYFRVKARAPTKWQLRQQDLPVPFESGTSDFLTLLGESAYVISGIMYPSSETTYDLGLVQLRTVASLDIGQADAFTDTGYVPYTWGDALGDYTKIVNMKPLYCQLAETTAQGYVQPFTIFSKIKDPTIYGGDLKTASTALANFVATTGTAAYSFTYPVVFGASIFSVSSTAINIGSLPSYPFAVSIHGPVNHPKLTNGATGEFIEVDVNMTSIGDILNVSYDKDSLDINLNGTSVIQNLTQDSTLFKIQPGINIFTLTGSSVSSYAYATVSYRDSWPLA